MFLIADSGSTKTHWVCFFDGQTRETVTLGLHPRLTDSNTFVQILHQTRKTLDLQGEPSLIYFYGAGCGTDGMKQRVQMFLSEAFPLSSIQVEGDLLGACRATCGNQPGLVGILGTGSNLCLYDGTRITRQRFSTGYILGDEGSGNHIGRKLLKDYLEGGMPKHLHDMFHDTYTYSNEELLDLIYRQPYPNRFLASLAPFAAHQREEHYIRTLLAECFEDFFRQLTCFGDYGNIMLHLTGGLTASFSNEIQAAASQMGYNVSSMVPDPMEGLLRYHKYHFALSQ